MLRHYSILALLVVGLAACAKPLPEDTTDEFTKLATSAASITGVPAELQSVALTGAAENQRLCQYLSGKTIKLGAPAKPPKPSELALKQAAAGKALKSYVQALTDATSGKSLQKLTEAQAGLTTAVTEFSTIAFGETQVGPVSEAAFALVSRVGEARRQERIREVMRDAIDPLFILEALLKRDVGEVTKQSEQAVAKWDTQAKCVLSNSRKLDGSIERFKEFDQRSQTLANQMKSIKRGPDAVKALRKAHILAVTEPTNFEEAIKDAVAVLKDFEALFNAVEG